MSSIPSVPYRCLGSRRIIKNSALVLLVSFFLFLFRIFVLLSLLSLLFHFSLHPKAFLLLDSLLTKKTMASILCGAKNLSLPLQTLHTPFFSSRWWTRAKLLGKPNNSFQEKLHLWTFPSSRYYSLPVDSLRQGYRNANLLAPNGRPIPLCTLFCRFGVFRDS